MADPYQYIVSTGVIVPQTEALYAEEQQNFLEIFGTDTIVTPDTPQGVLITALALAKAEEVQNNAAIANQINPNVAGGIFLDAVAALTGIQRTAATRTFVANVTLTGVDGTVIPAGTQAATATGDLFETISGVTIASGTATADFQSVEFGPIGCGIGALDNVVSNINGWETVTNDVAGVLGQNTQSDQALRAKRNNTLAFQGVALPEAITSSLYNITGVNSIYFQENVAVGTEVINGISMVGHSIWVCVDGGTDLEVAAALLENKSLGCAWNGTVEVELTEPSSGQEYTVKFERPDDIEFLVKVTSPNANTDNVKTAILAWQAGEINGMDGLKIGTDVSPFEISAAINALYPSTFVSKVEITLASDPMGWSTDVLEIAVDELAFTTSSDITVVTP